MLDLRPQHDLARMTHQHLEDLVLLQCQRDRHTIARHTVSDRINAQVLDRQDHGPTEVGPSEQRAQPREQFRERKRFGDVVVDTGVQRRHSIGQRITGGEHEDRHHDPLASEIAAHRQAVFRRQIPVDDQQSVIPRGRERLGVFGRCRDVDDVPLFAQTARNRLRGASVVFHEKQLHGVRVTAGDRRRRVHTDTRRA